MTAYLWSAAALVALVGTLLFFASRSSSPRILRLGTSFFFWLGMGYLALLLLVAGAYFHSYKSPQPYLIWGLLPVAVPWFGALGAVMISLEGVFLKNDQWNSKFNYWHIGRPLFGAVIGIVAFFLYLVIMSASGTKPKFLDPGQGTVGALDFIAFYMVAFLVGYREGTFRELIKRATDLILKPSTERAATPAMLFRNGGQPIQALAFPPCPVGTAVSQTIEIQNLGQVSLLTPTLEINGNGSGPTGVFVLNNDRVTGGGDLTPGQGRTVELTFTPCSSQACSATLIVRATNLSEPRTLPLSGPGC